MPAVIVLLLTFSLLPARAMHWAGWFGRLTDTFVAPISHPLAKLSRWLWPAGSRFDNKEMQQMDEERERLAQMFLREQSENQRLRDLIKEIQRGQELNPSFPVRQIVASVYRSSSDLSSRVLSVRVGEREGVVPGTVVTCAGLQLFGKVVEAGRMASVVQPITSKAAGRLLAQVMASEVTSDGTPCTLDPVGDGTLRGPISERPGSPVTVGMTVRLNDPDRWPGSAQKLLVGRVEAIEPDANNPLRQTIVVRPTVLLDRVSEVYLRLEGATGGMP